MQHAHLPLLALGGLFLSLSPSQAALIARWEFDPSPSNLTDTSGNSNTLTQVGTGSFVASTAFAGAEQAYNSPATANASLSATLTLPTGAAERTISLWINPDAQGDRKFIGYGTAGSGNNFDFTVEGGGVRFRHGGGNITYGSTPLSTWSHVVIRVPAGASQTGDVDIFINGVAALGTETGGGGSGVALNTGVSSTFFIGAGTSGANSFDGQIDDVQFYDSGLTDTQISNLFSNPGTVIPEPGSTLLLGLTGLAFLRRRR